MTNLSTMFIAFILVVTTLALDTEGEATVVNPWTPPQVVSMRSPRGSEITVHPVNEGIW